MPKCWASFQLQARLQKFLKFRFTCVQFLEKDIYQIISHSSTKLRVIRSPSIPITYHKLPSVSSSSKYMLQLNQLKYATFRQMGVSLHYSIQYFLTQPVCWLNNFPKEKAKNCYKTLPKEITRGEDAIILKTFAWKWNFLFKNAISNSNFSFYFSFNGV